jgi:ATP-dependent DNA helicase RecG
MGREISGRRIIGGGPSGAGGFIGEGTISESLNMKITQSSLRMGENSVLEFKTESVRAESIAKEIVAFANTDGGTLLIGVADDGTVQGVSDRKVEQRIVQICRNTVQPSLIPKFEFLEIEGAMVLSVDIPKGPNRPYKVKTNGKFYIRAGSSSVEPTNEELVRLFQNGDLVHFEIKPVHGAGIADLNRSYLEEYLTAYRAIDDPTVSEEEFRQVLYNLHLLERSNGDVVPTIAGMVLFGKNPVRYLPQTGVKAACFDGEDEAAELIEMKEFNGAVRDVLEGLLRFAERNSRTGVRFDAGEVHRTDIEQYPSAIVRELIANAIAHRDYAIWGAAVRLFVFRGRLEIRSPGSLPDTLTVERMKAGVSYHRNPIIMQTLKDYGFVEKIGRGILRSNRRLRQMGRKEIAFENLGVELRAVLYDR